MATRREFIQLVARIGLKSFGIIALGAIKVRTVFAEIKKRILPRGTNPRELFDENPEYLDTRNLEVTPIGQFDTMGDTDIEIDLDDWRLEVTGAVQQPLRLTYADLLIMPAVERKVLLICPGFFSYHGDWKGVSVQALLKRAGVQPGSDRLRFFGESPLGDKNEIFTMADLEGDAVFLAYNVNGRALPRKHGFPLRVVAEGHWGSEWVKYVYKVEVKGN